LTQLICEIIQKIVVVAEDIVMIMVPGDPGALEGLVVLVVPHHPHHAVVVLLLPFLHFLPLVRVARLDHRAVEAKFSRSLIDRKLKGQN
jgi:hypothetical protein